MQRDPDTPAELKARLDAERLGLPFVTIRTGAEKERLITLDESHEELTIGRSEDCDISLASDGRVSRLHALLAHRGASWVVDDSGISRNGTFVNGERLRAQRVLRDRDVIVAGDTEIRFFDPSPERTRTVAAEPRQAPPPLTPAQEKVLAALCVPYYRNRGSAPPPSNEEIARELSLSEETVRTHMRALFVIFGVADLPQSHKRRRLFEEAIRRGAVY